MRDYGRIDEYLTALLGDIYEQPPDHGHAQAAKDILSKWLQLLDLGTQKKTILDIGCGQGFCAEIVHALGWEWHGVTLGEDYDKCVEQGLPVDRADISFLPYDAGSFTLILARHIIEHSPMPLLTLMEWHRVATGFLLLVAPNGSVYGYCGKNHYYVLNAQQWVCLLKRAGWHPVWFNADDESEIRIMCQKK